MNRQTGFCLLAICFISICAYAQDAGIPRPEHPMPQAERTEWLNLNGTWEFAETNEDESAKYLSAEPYPEKIIVPFCRESKLSGIQRRPFVKNVWYRRSVILPAAWKSPRTRLHIGACDWRTDVWVNGQSAGQHIGGNVDFSFDITNLLKPGENIFIVHAFDDTGSGLQPLGKQSISGKSEGIFYTQTTGIWQTVWLEGVGASFIREFFVDTDPARERVSLNVGIEGPTEGLTVMAEAMVDGKSVAKAEVPAEWRNNSLVLAIQKPRLWSIQDPYLYDLQVTLRRGNDVVDFIKSYFGMRRVTIDGAAILINGTPVFQRLVLDQGFYPDGVWTAPSDEALRKDIELSQAAGFNGARLHQKVFEPRFLYWADKLGYLVWGEYPSYGANYSNPAVNAPILNEWVQIMERDRNHPSIIGWCPFNETEPLTGTLQAAVVRVTRSIDPSRPVIESSGYAHTIPDPEVLDAHDYDQNPESFRTRYKTMFSSAGLSSLPPQYGTAQSTQLPFMVSEYGGIGWSIVKGGWGYGNAPKTLDEFYARIKGLADALLDNPHVFGYCYTQLTNVEQEQNGIFMFDRTPKFDLDTLKSILGREAAYEKNPPLASTQSSKKITWNILLGSSLDGALARPWRYTEENPGEHWAQTAFNDSAWKEGAAPFGFKGGEWMEKIKTPWKSSDLWLRQEFTRANAAMESAAVVMHHDEDVEIFLNGKKICAHDRWNDRYEAFDVTSALKEALVDGKNIIAVHIHQTSGGQFFDMALLAGSI
ncbi:MAG TPA: glycoside hydrolase family 2 TIM barrel-domain containing protein [Candidatus Hydrogenedentes bacterium]|nr:glycoside hydrolase family 2 TIM barrel-domain containing protein [Candidatus Hydrogenedentota bacterium]